MKVPPTWQGAPDVFERRCDTCGVTVERMVPCRCDEARRDEVERAFFDQHRPDTVTEMLGAAEIPPRFECATFDTFQRRRGTEESVEAAIAWASSFTLATEIGLLLAGRFGCGKTHLAVAALRVAIERALIGGWFVSSGELIARVRLGNPITYEPIEQAIEAELLVLDDIGQEVATEFERGILTRVVMGRYDAALPTIFTSNHGPKGLEQTLGGAVVSRIREMAETHVMLATDYRARRAS